ncbi:MAG: GAF domain-containing protein, partial [Burkholderiales bacterium]|nr:GAF domain-containing protein [Anaerolineae bacterium]
MSMGIPLILFVGGLVILLWLFLWSRQKQQLNAYSASQNDLATTSPTLSAASADDVEIAASENDAVLVAKGHGQLVFINEPARRWLGLNGDDPSLEYVARLAHPADSFLELFAHEGQASFQLGERWVQAASHRIPTGTDTRTIVVMRELTGGSSEGAQRPETLDLSLAMRIINEIGETISANLRLDDVYQALLSIVARAVPIDAGEICLWDEEKGVLYPRGWLGDANYLVMLSEAGSVYEVGEGITGWVAQHRKPVLVSSLRDAAAVRPKLENNPYRSFVAVPLMLDERFLGTFELCSYKDRHFGQAELALLQAVTKHVSIAIRNAELYAEQAQRIDDMANLQQVARQQDDGSDNSSGVYLALNERIAKLLSAEICGVLLYDEERQTLIAEPPFYGLPYHVVSYIIPVPPGSPQRRFWETQGYWVSNHAETEPLIEEMGLKPLASVSGWRNVALITLQIGNRLVGALQVVNKRTDGGFTPNDVKDLRIIASQAAVVVENARLFHYERRRDIELKGLQELAHTIGAVHLDEEFYSEITRRIAQLMDVQMCGILLYDGENNRLVSQLPFYGLDDNLVSAYTIPLKPGSALDEIWTDEDYWYSNQVESDLVVYEAELEDLAAVLDIRKTLLAVLAAGGQRLGVIQVSNRTDSEDFTDKDARMLLTLATQSAALIENARLYREAQRRAEEADSLRHVAELAGGIVTTDDSVVTLLSEIADVMQSGIVFVNILDRQTGGLVSYPRWSHGVQFKDPLVQDVYSEGFDQTVAMSGQPFMTRDVMTDALVPPSYRMIAPKIGVKDLLIVPLSVGGRGLGELAVGNRSERSYDEDDERLLSAISSQIAATIDRLRLYESTGQNLSRRLQELDAISRVSNELTLTLDLDRVLDVIRHEAATATDAEGSTVVLLRPSDEWQNADTPELLRRLGAGDKVLPDVLADIEVRAVKRGADTVLVPDYGSSDLKAMPHEARSATAAAILYADVTVGVIHLYHQSANHFDDRAAAFLLTLAAKASLGYANALRYQEQMESGGRLRRRVEQLNQIFELGQMLHTNVDPVVILEAIAYSVQQSVGYDVVVMLMADDDAKVLRRVAQAGLPLEAFEQSRRAVLPIAELEKLLQTPFRISESAFFPVERVAEWLTGNLDALATTYAGNRSIESIHRNTWRDGDMLLVPLLGAGGELLGAMSLDRPQDDLRPERATIEILEIFAHQAAATIENTRLFLASIRNAEQEVRLNEVMEGIASTLDIAGIVESVARGALKLLPFSRMTVAMLDAFQQGFRVLRVSVDNDGTLRVTDEHRAHLQDTALGLTFDDGQDHLYHTDHPDIHRYEDLR